jgi:hypothetical protein
MIPARALLLLLTAVPVTAVGDGLFHAPQRLTDSAANHRMSANPSRQAAFDAQGTLHLAWWTGYLTTDSTSPSSIRYASWKRSGGWSSIETIDDSFDGSGNRIGGRNPSLALAPDGTAWVAWQDHRHCRGGVPYNWIDNTEVFADRKPLGGSFSTTDLRLTTSSTSHFGDNGYAPRIQASPLGDMRVAWYDFHFNANVSDLFLKTAPASSPFDLTETMAAMRRTRFEDRPAGGLGPVSFSHPEIAVSPTGQWYAAWTEGFGLPGPLRIAPIPAEGLFPSGVLVASTTDGFNNPAALRVAQDNALWVGWTDRTGGVSRVAMRRREGGSGTLGTTWFLTDGSVRCESLAFDIDAQGTLHATWVEVESFQQNTIRYAQFNAATRELLHEEALTPEPGPWVKPCVVLDSAGIPHVLYNEYIGDAPGDIGDIWFVAGVAPPSQSKDVFFLF